MQTSIIGIDPGAVHTGCVGLLFNEGDRTIDVRYELVQGVDVAKVREWTEGQPKAAAIFIEDYNPSNYGKTDKKMSEALGRLKAEFPPADHPYVVRYVDNAGINTLIPVMVQKVFGVHKFPVTTHHNDLNSAGKIALLGMLQDKSQHSLRLLISRVVQDELHNRAWAVTLHA